MATTKSSKATKRKARKSDRAHAAELVRKYDAGEVDDGYLVANLAYFAEFGTFGPAREVEEILMEMEREYLRVQYAELRKTMRAEDAKRQLVDTHVFDNVVRPPLTYSTLENILFRPKRKTKYSSL